MIPGLEFKTEQDIENHADSLSDQEWNDISYNLHMLSSEFAEKFQDKISWLNVASNRKNSIELIIKHQKKINLFLLNLVAHLSFRTKFGYSVPHKYSKYLEEIEKEPELIVRICKLLEFIENNERDDTWTGI